MKTAPFWRVSDHMQIGDNAAKTAADLKSNHIEIGDNTANTAADLKSIHMED